MARHGARVPRLLAGVDLKKLPLSPLEGFVLSRIDGLVPVALLAELTSLEVAEVDAIVERLIALGAAEWARESVSLPRATGREGAGPPPVTGDERPERRRGGGTVSPPKAPEPKRDPSARAALSARVATTTDEVDPSRHPIRPGTRPLASHTGVLHPAGDIEEVEVPAEERELDLDPERRRRIEELYAQLDEELDHYRALGVERSASRAEVRDAYFALSKLVHPDTMFRKRLGPYKAQMEALFSRITEAYEVLGKRKARQEYDRYLELMEETQRAETGLAASAAPEPAPEPAPVSAPARESEPPRPRLRVSAEAKARARAWMAAQLRSAADEASRIRSSVPPPPPPPAEPEPLDREHVLRSLASGLKSSAAHTGGLDGASRHVRNARRAEQEGDLVEAARELRLAMEMEPGKPELEAEHARVSARLAASLASTYEERARYEQLHGKWAAAALSWAKVFEGRPHDVGAAAMAAEALVEAEGDLHRAKELAQRALELAPEDARGHRALGRVYLAAGLTLSARRTLERAAALDPNNELVDALLRRLHGHA